MGMVKAGKAEAGSDPLAMVSSVPVAVPADTISSVAPCLAGAINSSITELRRLFLVDSMVDTIKFGLSLWLLTWIGLFTLPKVYIQNQTQVDEVLGKVMAQVQEVKGKVVALIPVKGGEKKE